MTPLAPWQTFYEITGSSAGALIGLQFVVLSLLVSKPGVRLDPLAGRSFSTPTIVHFSAVLTLASILAAPWKTIAAPTLLCGGAGCIGVVYSAIITRRIRRQSAYKPEFEDWLFFSLLPFVAYAALAVSAWMIRTRADEAPFGIAAAMVLLLWIGIHNTWDTVTYHVFTKKEE